MWVVVSILAPLAMILLATHDPFVIFGCSGVAGACAAWMLYSFISGQRQLRLAWLLASSILIGYCFGTCMVQFNAMSRGMSPMVFLQVNPAWVAYALVLVLVSCMLLLILGTIEKPLIRSSDIIDFDWRHERFLWAALGLILLAYIHGDMSINGTAVNESRISVVGGIAGPLASMIAPLAFPGVIRCSGAVRVRSVLITLCGLAATIPEGRRPFLYAVLLTGIAGSSMAGVRVRFSGFQKAALAIAGAVLVSVVSLLFIGLRLANNQIAAEGNHSITNVVRVANRTSFTTLNQTAAALDENVQERPGGLVTYLAQLTRNGDTPAPLLGRDLALGIELAIPNVAYRLTGFDKTEVASLGGEETLANERVGLPSDLDGANSLLSAGAVDFGVPGAVVYPALWTIFVLVVIAASRSFLPRSVIPVMLIAFLNEFLLAENPIGGYFSDLRSIAMLGIIWALVYYIPTIGLQQRAAVWKLPVDTAAGTHRDWRFR